MLVILDPGHGLGNRKPGIFDSGAIGIGGAREADYTLSYCQEIKAYLVGAGHQVQMTRSLEQDSAPLLYRLRMAKRFQPAAFLSVHFNATALAVDPADGIKKGFQVLWRTEGSQQLAETVASELKAAGRKPFSDGVERREDLLVLVYQPSALLEAGFIDDPDEFPDLSAAGWRDQTCKAVAGGICKFLAQEKKT